MTRLAPPPSKLIAVAQCPKPGILKTAADYEAALAHLNTLMDATPGSEEEAELELWALLVENYEAQNHPLDPPDPIEAIRFRMEQEGLRQKDLARFLPGKSRVSEVLHGKRPLTLAMIRSLHKHLKISAEILIAAPKTPAEPGKGEGNQPPRAQRA